MTIPPDLRAQLPKFPEVSEFEQAKTPKLPYCGLRQAKEADRIIPGSMLPKSKPVNMALQDGKMVDLGIDIPSTDMIDIGTPGEKIIVRGKMQR